MNNIGEKSMIHYTSGEVNGIKWFLDINPTTQEFIITATNGINTKTEKIYWLYKPAFGVLDYADINQIEGVLDKFINELSNNE